METTDRRLRASSPVHRAVWDRTVPVELFDTEEPLLSPAVRQIVTTARAAVERRVTDGTVYGADGVISTELIAELAGAGFWGLRAAPEYGGSGASFSTYMPVLTQMAVADPWVGVLASMQAGLGPVTTLNAFATEEQKQRLLTPLARGMRLGVFATTEPATASDLRAIRTHAVRSRDILQLTGEKFLITNAAPARTGCVLCRVDGELRMLVVELPDAEDDHFQLVHYGVRAFRHVAHRALAFHELPVPADNLLDAPGLVVAYHALNHGRVAACAGAGGLMRRMTGSMIPWVQTRETFGAPIGTRELVQRRLGRMAARIVGCDALSLWAAALLDNGYRGELESVVAKVVGSEMLKEAAVDLMLKTHGGRALLEGNMFADDVYDMVAPTVYEGENEILTLGLFRAVSREHAAFLAGVGDALGPARHGAPVHLWHARGAVAQYGRWLAPRQMRAARPLGAVPMDLDDQTTFAARLLQGTGVEIDAALRHYGAELVHRQAVALELAQRVTNAAAMLTITCYGRGLADAVARQAAACMANELGQRLTRRRPTSDYYRQITQLGEAVAEDQFDLVRDAPRDRPIMPQHLFRAEHPKTRS